MAHDLFETLKETAIAFAKAYEDPRPWDPNDVWQYRTEDSIHCLHPNENLPDAFKKPLDKEAYFGALRFFGAVMDRTRFDVKDVVVDVKQRKVVLYLRGTFDLKAVGDEPPVEGWSTEYMLLMEFEESGRKIKRVEEFMDSERLMREIKSKAERYAKLQASDQ